MLSVDDGDTLWQSKQLKNIFIARALAFVRMDLNHDRSHRNQGDQGRTIFHRPNLHRALLASSC
jgi:hypothetical protein